MGEGEYEGESPAGDPGWLLQKNYLKKRSGIFRIGSPAAWQHQMRMKKTERESG